MHSGKLIRRNTPDGTSALRRLAEKNIGGLHARAYASGGDNRWYGIVLGGPHFSLQAATETLAKARRVIPQYVDAGAWIKSYDVGRWLRQATE